MFSRNRFVLLALVAVLVGLLAGAAAAAGVDAGEKAGLLSQVGGWLLGALACAWAWVRRNRVQLLGAAAQGVAFAEKFYAGAANEVLEEEAVRYVREYWPWLPEYAVRWGVREVCRLRKSRGASLAVPS